MQRHIQWILVLICTAGPILSLTGQLPVISSELELRNYMNSQQYRDNRTESNIEGSPCINEEFTRGTIFYNQRKYGNLELRYNNYKGCFEYRDGIGIKYLPPRVFRLDTVWLGKDIYLYTDYLEGKAVRQAFMKLLHRGKLDVLSYHKVILLPAEPPAGYKEARPARFEAQTEVFYLQREGEAKVFRGKKSIPELFPRHQKELLQFAKKNGLRLKIPEEIIRLVQYYESLD